MFGVAECEFRQYGLCKDQERLAELTAMNFVRDKDAEAEYKDLADQDEYLCSEGRCLRDGSLQCSIRNDNLGEKK